MKELLHGISCYISLPVLGYNKDATTFPYQDPLQTLSLRLGGEKKYNKVGIF